MQLIKDFTAEHACDKVEFYHGDGRRRATNIRRPHVQHLKNAFQSGEIISELISNFYDQAQKKNESEDMFVDELQILV